jgi:Prenyltransferase and squalene oxidase repeat
MRVSLGILLVAMVAAGSIGTASRRVSGQVASPSSSASAEARAVAYLLREVPAWRREHPCYSCHNNGDAVRALVAATARGHATRPAIDDTLKWLAEARRWESNGGGEGGGDDKRLMRIQFAHAATAAASAALIGKESLRAAAAIVSADQQPDGSWQLDSSDSIGSPATYGTVLATLFARRTLAAAAPDELKPQIARADRWLSAVVPTNLPDAAAIVLSMADSPSSRRPANWTTALDLIARGQGSDGGWGGYVTSPAQAFDTAIAVLSLHELRARGVSGEPAFTKTAVDSAIERGRKYLLQQQLDDGSWQETTRPAGQSSYAQRISTTAWALLALFATPPPES